MNTEHPMLDVLNQAMDKIMRPEALSNYRKQRADDEARLRGLIGELNRHGMYAISQLISAMQCPRQCVSDLLDAREALDKAIEVGRELDPPEAA